MTEFLSSEEKSELRSTVAETSAGSRFPGSIIVEVECGKVMAMLDEIDAQAARIAELERERDALRADFLEFTHLGRRLCTPESPVADQVRDYNRRLDEARRRWAGEKD